MAQPRTRGAPSSRGEDRGRVTKPPNAGITGKAAASHSTSNLDRLALDSSPTQKEHRHQAIIDPVIDGLAQSDRSDPDFAGRPQQRFVGRSERRVCDDESRDGGEAENDTAIEARVVGIVGCWNLGRHRPSLPIASIATDSASSFPHDILDQFSGRHGHLAGDNPVGEHASACSEARPSGH